MLSDYKAYISHSSVLWQSKNLKFSVGSATKLSFYSIYTIVSGHYLKSVLSNVVIWWKTVS